MDAAEIKARIEELENVEAGGAVKERLEELRKGLAEVEAEEAHEAILAAKRRDPIYRGF